MVHHLFHGIDPLLIHADFVNQQDVFVKRRLMDGLQIEQKKVINKVQLKHFA